MSPGVDPETFWILWRDARFLWLPIIFAQGKRCGQSLHASFEVLTMLAGMIYSRRVAISCVK